MGLRIRPRLLVAFWLGFWLAAFALTHVPIRQGGRDPIPHLDKVAHAAVYFLLTYLGGLRLLGQTPAISARVLLAWAAIYAAYGAMDEFTQPITGRDADLADWVFDALGVVLATISLWRGLVPRWLQ